MNPATFTTAVVSLLVYLLSAGVCFKSATLLDARHTHDTEILFETLTEDKARDIERLITRLEAVSESVAALVRNSQGQAQEFEGHAKRLVREFGLADAVLLAPGNIIQTVYPPDQGTAIVGRDLMQLPELATYFRRAVESGRPVLLGPYRNVSGVQVINLVKPVSLTGPGQSSVYWGMVLCRIRLDRFLEDIRLSSLETWGLGYRLSRQEEDGLHQTIAAYGDPGPAAAKGVAFQVPGGTWHLEVFSLSPSLLPHSKGVYALFSAAFGLLPAGFVFLLLRRPEHLSRQVRERTRELTEINEKLLEEMAKRRKAQEALARSERFYREMFSSHGAPQMLVDPWNGRIAEANAAACAFYGYGAEEMKGMVLAALGQEDPQVVARFLAEARLGATGPLDCRQRLADGSQRHVEIYGGPLNLPHAQYVALILHDVSLKRQAQEDLDRNTRLLTSIIETIPDHLTIHDGDLKVLMSNSKIFAQTRELGHQAHQCADCPLCGPQPCRDCPAKKAVLTGKPQFRRTRPSPDQTIEIRAYPLVDKDSKAIMVVEHVRDVTEQIQAEERLRASEARYRKLIETMSEGLGVLDQDRRLVLVNPAFMALLGRSEDEILGRDWIDFVDPSARAQAIHEFEKRRNGRGSAFTIPLEASDGRVVECRVAASPLFSEDGTFLGSFGVYTDITEELSVRRSLQASRTRLQSALDAAESASFAKSQFLASMSHEMRTPLNAILGYADLALEREVPDQVRGYLRIIKSASDTLRGLVGDVLDFSRVEAGRLQLETGPLSLRELLSNIRDAQQPQALQKGLNFIVRLDPGIPEVMYGDALRITQVLSNLACNAVKFTGAGQVSLEADLVGQADGQAAVRFLVSDTGMGLDLLRLSELFSAFTQADDASTRLYGGTGLGLTICDRLVSLMGSALFVSSSPEHGSTFAFTLRLPHTESPGAASPAERPRNLAPSFTSLAGARVLVVEDNELNAELAVELLGLAGASCKVALHGARALELLDEQRFDAVLMDVQMPVMDGVCATKTLRERPGLAELPVVALTAHAMSHERSRLRHTGFTAYLAKPLDRSLLLATLDAAISGQPLPWQARLDGQAGEKLSLAALLDKSQNLA